MADQAKELLVAWLRDAHAMEESLETALRAQVDHAKDNPVLRTRLQQHIIETKDHAARMQRALERHGSARSVMKDTGGKLQAGMQGMMSSMSSDTAIKDVLTGVAAEHFEIACYTSLEAAARSVGDVELAEDCTRILADERSMAEFLESQIAATTRDELSKVGV